MTQNLTLSNDTQHSNIAPSLMAQEAKEAPSKIAMQLQANEETIATVVKAIEAHAPKYVYMIGRGSSDHAAVFARYLIEIEIGIPVAHAALSIASVYKQTINLADALVIVISQSGRSPDLLAQVEMAKKSGALVVALVNDVTSPLVGLANYTIALHAGVEQAVAATKSYLATLSAILHLVSAWSKNKAFQQAVQSLPSVLEQAIAMPSQLQASMLCDVKHLVVLGRGFGYAVSREIALKLKEVCGIQAEAFSSAEFLHGPVALVKDQFAIIDVAIEDESEHAHQKQIEDVKSRGANVVHLHHNGIDAFERLLPLVVLQRFYLDVEVIARHFGVNPDAPPGLNKVTKTV